MYYTSDDLEFIQVLDDEDVHTRDANKLVHKNGRWRLWKVEREIPDNGWGNGGGWRKVPIEYKSEGS